MLRRSVLFVSPHFSCPALLFTQNGSKPLLTETERNLPMTPSKTFS